MKKLTILISALVLIFTAGQAMAMQEHDSHGSSDEKDMQTDKETDHSSHGSDMESSSSDGTFKHHASMDGMNADFQVMSLASMNMTSDKGETHHIMVNLAKADGGEPVKNAVGKIKVVGPDGIEMAGNYPESSSSFNETTDIEDGATIQRIWISCLGDEC